MIENETQLLDKASTGDVDAFAELFESYRPVVYAVACRVAGPDDADDIVMETYLKAWRSIAKFNRRAALKTWLYRITYNCALDFIRSRGRRQERVMRIDENDERRISDLEDEAQETPDQEIARSEDAALVQEALQQMDEPHRMVLLMRYADDMSYAEIAAAADLSMGTVMSRLFNAKRKLKNIISQMEI